jgi:lysophospholipase L1-like esterase
MRAMLAASALAAAVMQQPARPSMIRIVALGDSTTAGTPGFESPIEAPPDGRGDVTSQFAYWLMQAHPEWDVLNRGVNGERTDQIAARFERDVLGARPAIVVIIAGVNDVYQGRPVAEITERLQAMYERAHQSGIAVVAGTIIPYDTATPEQNQKMHQINAWIRSQHAAFPALASVDTRAAVAARDDPDRLASSPDSLHPAPEGYRAMADALRPVIERLVKR